MNHISYNKPNKMYNYKGRETIFNICSCQANIVIKETPPQSSLLVFSTQASFLSPHFSLVVKNIKLIKTTA